MTTPTSLTLDANEVRFLAARLRRLFQHFGAPVPGMEDDARLIGNAGAGIGLLLAVPMNGADKASPRSDEKTPAPAVLPLLPIAQAYARLLQHAGTDDKLATDLERLRHSHWTHWTAEENHVVATAVRVLRELNNWRLSNQPPNGTT